MADEVKSNNRRPIIWGDALLDRSTWGKPYFASSRIDQKTHNAIKHLSKDIIIADWQYDIKEKSVKTIDYFIEHGFDVLTCPWDNIDNARILIEEAHDKKLLGVLMTTWHHLPMQLTQLLFSASAAWSHDMNILDYPQYGDILIITAGYLTRILSPAEGVFSQAGWPSIETAS